VNVKISPEDSGYLLETTLRVPRPLEEVFGVFSDAKNLEQLTPHALRFEILTPDPIVMKPGSLLDYRLRLHGIPIRWQSEISVWEPPRRFEDRQRKGPYRWWIHEHSFVGDDDHTVMTDRVKYGVPGGALVHGLFVARDLRKIFQYRANQFCHMLGVPDAECDSY
jgi:ligand-binding SRPBCC domain-containing protein